MGGIDTRILAWGLPRSLIAAKKGRLGGLQQPEVILLQCMGGNRLYSEYPSPGEETAPCVHTTAHVHVASRKEWQEQPIYL